jgi:hypothetical protein
MIHTPLQLIEETLRHFERTDRLARSGKRSSSCRYSRRYNEVGCAIGCHLPEEWCQHLDNVGTIDTIWENEYDQLSAYFDTTVLTRADLRELQVLHDSAEDYAAFVHNLHTVADTLRAHPTQPLAHVIRTMRHENMVREQAEVAA